MTSGSSTESISSLAPDYGKSPHELQAGLLADLFGPPLVRVSRSRSPAKGEEPMTQGTCGRTYFASSAPSGPLASWENRLRERLATLGSTESALIWKASATPSGRSKSRLVQSTVHKNGPGTGGSQWPTATVGDSRNSRNATANRSPDSKHHTGTTLCDAMMSQWPAPTVADVTGGRKTRSGVRSDEMLLNGLMAQWCAPSARDWKDTPGMSTTGINPDGSERTRIDMLPRQMAHFGPAPSGSNAPTGKRGAPNPVFACWLMGWPDELTFGALQAIQSFRSSRRKSSRQSSKLVRSVETLESKAQ